MMIAVAKETREGETRVAMVPELVGKLTGLGYEVAVEPDAGRHALVADEEFTAAGAGQSHHKTSIVYEFPTAEGDPYYPVPRKENTELYERYKALADATPNVHFVGRLATYRYYNMDQVVAQSLALFDQLRGVRADRDSEATQAA